MRATLGCSFSTSRNKRLAHLLQTRGHTVVQLPSDAHQAAELSASSWSSHCSAEPFEGRVECLESYTELTRFEKLFLSELEETILGAFEVTSAELSAGPTLRGHPGLLPLIRRTEISPFSSTYSTRRDHQATRARHLQPVPFNGRRLLPRVPRTDSQSTQPKVLWKRRRSTWTSSPSGDPNCGCCSPTTSKSSPVEHNDTSFVLRMSESFKQEEEAKDSNLEFEDGAREPKLVRIEGSEEFADLFGYYLRIPTSATALRTATLSSNVTIERPCGPVTRSRSLPLTQISTAFQFEVRLDQLITTTGRSYRSDPDDTTRTGALRGALLPTPSDARTVFSTDAERRGPNRGAL